MKLYKIFAFIFAAALVLAGCKNEIEREPSPEFPKDVKDVYFPVTDERGMEVDPSAGIYTYTVTIARKDSTGALTVPLNVVLNTDSIFKVPASVSFEDGEAEAEFVIDFTGAKDGVTYYLDIQADMATVNPYTEGYSEYLFSVTPIKWVKAEKPAIFNDALFSGAYGVPGYYWYVNYEYAELGGGNLRFRFADVYSSMGTGMDAYGVVDAFPYNEEGDYDAANVYYTIINVNADGDASMPIHDIGVDWGYGNFAAGSTRLYLEEAGSDAVDDYADGYLDEDGVITFAAGDVYLYISGYGPQLSDGIQYIYLDPEVYYAAAANSKISIDDYEDGFNDANIEWNEVELNTKMFESQLANGESWNQKLLNAVDPNSVDSLDPTSDFYNLYYLPDLYNQGYGMAFYYDSTTNKLRLPQDVQPTGEKWAGKKINIRPSSEAESYVDSIEIGGAKITMFHFMLEVITEEDVIVASTEEVFYMSTQNIVWSIDDYTGNFVLTGKSFWASYGYPDAEMPVTITKSKKGLTINGIENAGPVAATFDAATGYMTIASGQEMPALTMQGVDYDTYFLTDNPDDEDDLMQPLVFAASMSGIISLHESSPADGYLLYVENPDDPKDAGFADGYYDLVLTPLAADGAPKRIVSHNNEVPTIMKQIRNRQQTGRIDTSDFRNLGKAQRHPVKPGSLKVF